MKTAEQILKSKLTIEAMRLNNPDYTFNKVIEAMEEYAQQQLKNCNLQNVSNNEVAVCGKCKGRLENHLDYLHCTNCDLWYEPQTDC